MHARKVSAKFQGSDESRQSRSSQLFRSKDPGVGGGKSSMLQSAAATADGIQLQMDAVEEIRQQPQSWSLRFQRADMERQFQFYHEDMCLHHTSWACLATLAAVGVMQAGAWYRVGVEVQVIANTANVAATANWTLLIITSSSTLILGTGWIAMLVAWRQRTNLCGRLQIVLLALAIAVVLIILAIPAYGPATPPARATSIQHLLAELERTRSIQRVTKMILFELMALSVIATMWNIQFFIFSGIATFTAISTCAWTILISDYWRREWHVFLLFLGIVSMIGGALYRWERHLRNKFLKLRHLVLENIKLSQQNNFMQQQLSSHMDAIGVSDSRNSNGRNNDTGYGSSLASGRSQTMALGESRMENVLKTLVRLKFDLGDNTAPKEDAVYQLESVIQALTSGHDLFQANGAKSSLSSRRAQSPGSQLDNVEATAWLSLLNVEPRHRRRQTAIGVGDMGLSRDGTFPPSGVGAILRRTDSGFEQSVLHHVDALMGNSRKMSSGSKKMSRRATASPSSLRTATSSWTENKVASSPVSEQWTASKLLQQAGRSNEVDLFELARVCAVPLSAVLLTTIESHNLFLHLPLRVESTAAFAREIERRYQSKNPYHNALHATSVVWDVNYFLQGLEQQQLSPLQLLSALVAAAVHDVNHPGVNNAYLVASSSPLAIKYSDDSVLERMHLAECFQVCSKDGCDVFEAFPRDLRRQSRQLIIAMVLSTDLSKHVKHVNRLKSKWYALQSTDLPPSSLDAAAGPVDALLPVELVLQSLIMMADLGHAFKSFEAHEAWSRLVADEFFLQGDTERQFQLPVSPLCDRRAAKLETSQIGFLEFVVLPLYVAVRDVLPLRDFDAVLARIRLNADEWRRRVALHP